MRDAEFPRTAGRATAGSRHVKFPRDPIGLRILRLLSFAVLVSGVPDQFPACWDQWCPAGGPRSRASGISNLTCDHRFLPADGAADAAFPGGRRVFSADPQTAC
ncbi:MAG TPA: hypothetical protein VFV66_28360 [Nonomuraea sp.]|nr:hypothetical protein [Nonomuraea sp.]